MADKKISELVSLAGKDVAATDLFPVVDVNVAEIKSLTRDELRNAVNAIQFAATKAIATTAAASLPDDTIIEVAADESLSGARTRYTVAAGALVFAYGVDIAVRTDDFGGDISLAIAKGIADGLPNIVIDLGEVSFFNGIDTSFFGPTKIITAENVWLRGKGLPQYNADSTALVGGSRIMGGLFFAANGFKITDCGIDCGKNYVDANNAGAPIEGLVGVDRGNTGMYGYTSTGVGEDPYKDGLYIDNVCVLSKGTGAAGDTSDVHAALIENYRSGYIGSLETRFGGAGVVIKSSNLKINKIVASGHYKYSLLFKSEDYSDASNNNVSLAIVRNFKTLSPDINGTADYDTSGVWFQAANANCSNNRVQTVIADSVTDAVVFDALAPFTVNSCSVGKMVSKNMGGYPAQTRGTCNDCVVENMDHSNSKRGVYIQASATRCGVTDAVVRNVLQYSYVNYGVDSIFSNCMSINPGFAHIALYAGNANFLGDFAVGASNTKPLLAITGGTYTGLFRHTGVQNNGLTVSTNNLIINGNGESTTGWTTPGNNALVTSEAGGVSGNRFKLAQPTAAVAYFTQQFATTSGKKYKVSLYQQNGSGPGTVRFFAGKTTYLSAEYTGGTFVLLNNATATKYEFEFVATAATCFITFQPLSGAGCYTYLDEIVCNESVGVVLNTGVSVAGSVVLSAVPTFANNAAAVSGGVGVGGLYRTGSDPDQLCIVH